jgi:hypothetical protein
MSEVTHIPWVNTKYPRTYHLPYSPGATKDDKKLQGDWFKYYIGQEVVITAKLDGENSAMTAHDVYARSHAAPTRNPWNRNLWDPQTGLFWKIKQYIGENETIYGENLYGEHSIHYNKLTDYFHLFAANDGVNWYSWDDVKMMADIMNIPHVPELWRGIIYKESDLQKLVEQYVHESEWYGDIREGVVVRITDSFPLEDFVKHVCKWVRPNHVQTDEHWTKHWKKAELNYE